MRRRLGVGGDTGQAGYVGEEGGGEKSFQHINLSTWRERGGNGEEQGRWGEPGRVKWSRGRAMGVRKGEREGALRPLSRGPVHV